MDRKSRDVVLTRAIAEIQESNLNVRDAQCSQDIHSSNAFRHQNGQFVCIICKLTSQKQNKTNVYYCNADMFDWSGAM